MMALPTLPPRFQISKFNQDILPSCLCFLTAANYLLFGNLPLSLVSIAGATSCMYLLSHPMGYNFTFHSSTAKTPVEEVRYDVTRSLFHGLTATGLFSHTCVKVAQRGLSELGMDETGGRLETVKAVAWVVIVGLLWCASMGVAWWAAVGDVGKWEKVADEMTEERREKKKFLDDRALGSKLS